MMFKHNEVFEGTWKDRTLFAVPHNLKDEPTVIHGMVKGVNLSWYISFDEKCIYVGFEEPPNERFMFSWD